MIKTQRSRETFHSIESILSTQRLRVCQNAVSVILNVVKNL